MRLYSTQPLPVSRFLREGPDRTDHSEQCIGNELIVFINRFATVPYLGARSRAKLQGYLLAR